MRTRICDVATGQLVRVFMGERAATVRDVSWSPDSRFLVTNDNHQFKMIWDVETGQLLWTRYQGFGTHLVAWSPDGRKIAYPDNVPDGKGIVIFDLASDGASIQCFDWPSGELRGTLTPLGNRFVLIDASGNFADTATTETELESSFVYVVQERDRQMTYSPSEFEAKYGRKNNSQQARVFGSSN